MSMQHVQVLAVNSDPFQILTSFDVYNSPSRTEGQENQIKSFCLAISATLVCPVAGYIRVYHTARVHKNGELE